MHKDKNNICNSLFLVFTDKNAKINGIIDIPRAKAIAYAIEYYYISLLIKLLIKKKKGKRRT